MLVNASQAPEAALFQALGLIVICIGAVAWMALDSWSRSPEAKRQSDSLTDAERQARDEWQRYVDANGWKE